MVKLLIIFMLLTIPAHAEESSKVRLVNKKSVIQHQQNNFGRNQVYRKDGEIIMEVTFGTESTDDSDDGDDSVPVLHPERVG